MTEHVRRNYRNHRKTTWGVAIALMVAIAAVVIPIASGAADKNYTLLFPSAGAVTPTPPVSGSTTGQTLCSGSPYAVKVAITNTAKSSQLGSADITFPANVTLSNATLPAGSPAAWRISSNGNVVSLRQLSLPKNGVVTLTAALGAGGAATSAQAITARVNSPTTSATRGRTPTRMGSTTRQSSRRSASRRAPRPSRDACTTTATRAARSRSTPRRRRATSPSRAGW